MHTRYALMVIIVGSHRKGQAWCDFCGAGYLTAVRIRYDTVYLTCIKSLPHGTNRKIKEKRTKK